MERPDREDPCGGGRVRSFPFAGQTITDDSPCLLIAEIGNNHGGAVQTAIELITTIAECGWSAAKLQCRDNETLYTRQLRSQPYDNPNSFGSTYGAHRDALELRPVDLIDCLSAANDLSLPLFATAFDEQSATRIAELGMPAIKIASGSVTDEPLLTYVSRLGLPVILSTGGSSDRQIRDAVDLLDPKVPLALLHCTAAYPVRDWSELNLRCILTLRKDYPDLVIGWSGHDSGIAMSMIAYTFGARIIEKHVTLNRAMKGTDHAFSLEPAGMRKLARDLSRAHLALGDGEKRVYDSERGPIAKMRRQLLHGKMQIGTAEEIAHATH